MMKTVYLTTVQG